jgi:light-regulated signal transduction histidine kinase (bacteriophytochrome)
VKDHVNEGRLWRAIVRAVSQRELRQRLAESMRALTSANASLEQEVAAHRATEAELRAAKEAAERADQAKTRFVAMVTHELRTPLNGILGYAQLLRLEGELSAQQNARVAAMIQSGQHLFGMVERVLDVASIEAGRMELHPVPLSVRALPEPHGAVPILALTAGVLPEEIAERDAADMDGLVVKPVEYRKLTLSIAGTLGGRKSGWGINGGALSQIGAGAETSPQLGREVLDRLLT